MKKIEIEFKNLLTLAQYNEIYNYYKLDNIPTITNNNYYYDTKNEKLKEYNAALRIRHSNILKELTLKIKKDKKNIEINKDLFDDNIQSIINFSNLPIEIKEYLSFLDEENLFLNEKIETIRKEISIDGGLLVLDKNNFLNGIVDYELEFEVKSYEKGKIIFSNILKKFEIQKKEALPKIARAKNYRLNIKQ